MTQPDKDEEVIETIAEILGEAAAEYFVREAEKSECFLLCRREGNTLIPERLA